jgi:hypothetical protein
MTNTKYITKDSLDAFLIGMSKYETTELLHDLNVLELLDGKVPKDPNRDFNDVKIAEAFLYLFQEREDYELCEMLIKNWPQLRK